VFGANARIVLLSRRLTFHGPPMAATGIRFGGGLVRYVALVRPPALRRIEAIVNTAGTVLPAHTVGELLGTMQSAAGMCAIVDPSLMTPADAAAVVAHFVRTPQAIVAYAPTVREAFESSIVLAQGTTAQFVFQGMPDEAAALRQALLLPPDAQLGRTLATSLAPSLDALPHQLRVTVGTMLQTGIGPRSADALAAQGGIARRSMDRSFEIAGLESSRFFIAAAQIVRVYRAVAFSRLPFRRLAAMAGYAAQRTLDHHFETFLGCSSGAIRKQPLPVDDVAHRLATRLTLREASAALNAPRTGDHDAY